MKPKSKKPPLPSSYRIRSYRTLCGSEGLVSFQVRIKETDLQILASIPMPDRAHDAVLSGRSQVEGQVRSQPAFLNSLEPLPMDPTAPPIIRAMLEAGQAAGVGPMAAVAGAIAEYVGRSLLAAGADEVMVENGGDIFLARKEDSAVGIFAGTSPLSGTLALKIPGGLNPLGVCTSSSTVGHSLSFGNADAVTVLAQDTALADAAATRLGNEVSPTQGIGVALTLARQIPGLLGVLIIRGEELGAWGEIELLPL